MRSIVELLLASKFPMFVAWGEEFGFVYNDPYAEILGAKHPTALGARFRDIWPEIWSDISPLIDQAMAGEASYRENLPLLMNRKGFDEQTWFTFSYSPVRDESGEVSGLFCVCAETTAQVLAEQRRTFRLSLEERLAGLLDPRSIMDAAIETLGRELGASRVGYSEMLEDDTTMVRACCYVDGVEPLLGAYELAVHGAYNVARLRAGEVLVCDDVQADPQQVVAMWAAIDTRGFASVPLIRNGRLTASCYVNFRDPHRWTTDEVSMVDEVATRTWDAVERARAEQALRESENLHKSLSTSLEAGFCIIEMKFDESGKAVDYRFVEVNRAFEAQTGLKDATGRWMRDLAPDLEQHWFDTYGRVAASGEPVRFENEADALGRWFDVHAFRVGDPLARRVAVLFNDVSERRRAEQTLRDLNATLEERVIERTADLAKAHEILVQSQKMEAVGQLTGGLAHDFNNLLAAISGSLEILQARLTQGRFNDLGRFVGSAQGAAKRAAALTHRLLAFSRRQTLDPKATVINRLVSGMEEMIRRTMGPEITVEIVAAGGLWTTLVDPSQLENALLNLCINARDAMPGGGRLTIETGNRWLDERGAQERDVPPGQYISLSVSDTGTGMAVETVRRAFEPFFTTKPLGMGTGLGLSMVYGFVRQSGGQARIYSEPDHGTTVSLYLPRHYGEIDEDEAPMSLMHPARAAEGETVLVIDDEATVRMLVAEVLSDLGYIAIEAADGPAGLKVLQSDVRIDLLVTDVGLPGGMNGRQVADAAREHRPALKVLFITGYAENAVVGNGHLHPGMHVLTKPFAIDDLSNRIKGLIVGAQN